MSAGDSERADMVDRLDAPFWVKAWNWMFDPEWSFNTPPFDEEGEAPPNKEEASRRWRFDRLRRLPNKQDGQSG